MSLNNIQLQPPVITELYRNSLTALNGITPEKSKDEIIPILYLGNNKKQILLLVQNPGHAFLPDKTLEFLTGILSACKFSLQDIALVNLSHAGENTYLQLVHHFRPAVCLLLGVAPSQIELPIHFPHFQVQQYNGVSYLSSPPLESLAEDKLLKSKLWLCLKQIFSL
ncbi:MAG: hypothetical protein SFU87_11130 [Chitinophagaceae bacterium]|nr:hypothetical protein [Chitinophagaceae bacterium]